MALMPPATDSSVVWQVANQAQTPIDASKPGGVLTTTHVTFPVAWQYQGGLAPYAYLS